MPDSKIKNKTTIFVLFIAYSIILYFFLDILAQKTSHYSTIFHYYTGLAKTTSLTFPIFLIFALLIPAKFWSKVIQGFEQVNSKKFIVAISLLGLVLLSAIAWFVYEGVPKGDAVNVFFQTKIFSSGKLFAPLPNHPEFFQLASMIQYEGKWFAMLPPGHALILVPFYLLNLGWLCGPILGVISLILIFVICRRYFDVQTAKLATVLAVISPYFLLIQASFLPHSSGIVFGLLFFLFFLKALSSHKTLHYFLAGCSAGMLFLIRPYSAIAFIFPFVIYSFYLLIKRKVVLKNFLPLGFGITIFCLMAILYNKALTGNFLTFPYHLHSVAGYNRIGFGVNVGAETFGVIGHNPIKAMINLGYNFLVTSLHLHGTPLLSLLPAIFFVWKGTKRREDYLLIAIIGSLLLFHFFYWFHGVNPMGSRYYFEIIFAMLILNARGIILISQKLADKFSSAQVNHLDRKNNLLARLLILILIFNLTIYLPRCFRFFKTSGWGETKKIYQLVKNIDSKTLVFIKAPELTTPLNKNVNMFIYGSGFNYNDPWLSGKHLFVHWLRNEQNQELKQFYSDRESFIVTFNESTNQYFIQPY